MCLNMERAMPSGIFTKGILLTAFCLLPLSSYAIDRGQYENVPQHIRDWFKSVKSRNGVPCCDISDGHRTEYDMRNSQYWVPIEGTWIQVPPEAVIHNADNPVGDAVVWYAKVQNNTYIRCFVPGSGV